MFNSFLDRLPDKQNPAYKDYCEVEGISPDEINLIILLGTIGKRGPSTFVYEFIYEDTFKATEITEFRENLEITQHDFALAFDIKELNLQRIEAGKTQDFNTLKRIQITFRFPDVALWTLKQNGRRLHVNTLSKLVRYFESQLNN